MLDWLKEIRIEKNITQEKLSSVVGISRAHYSNIENGKRCKPDKIIVEKRIAEVLGFKWTRFFEDEQKPEGTSEPVNQQHIEQLQF